MDKQEQTRLNDTVNVINQRIEIVQKQADSLAQDIDRNKDYISNNHYELSKSGNLNRFLTELSQSDDDLKELNKDLRTLEYQKNSPYFERIDFKRDGQDDTQVIYVGLGNVISNDIWVYDWRAPVSAMCYDFGLGKAFYLADKKKVEGELTLKRQYKIEKGVIKSYFDTNLTIEDEILQELLSKNTSTKMKQIVSTIQKEQNSLVRTEEKQHFLVQGVAGSGKTSIALHRAAYLLYKHRKQISSSDIIIISPNNVFSSYISDVLPQLGEDNLVETTFDQIACVELRKAIQPREEMVDEIASSPSQELLNEISFKSSFEFLDELLKFLNGDFLQTYTPQTLTYVTAVDEENNPKETMEFKADEMAKIFFEDYHDMPIFERINKMAWQYAMRLTQERHYNKNQNAGLRERFKKILYDFLPLNDFSKIYEVFMTRIGLKVTNKNQVNYIDKGAMLIIKHFIYGFSHDFSAKYLIIDEMQDFTPVDLYIFKKIWSCPSILLGDINQCIEKNLSDAYLDEVAKFWGSELVKLTKTYRSTKQIAKFAHEMIGLKNIEYVNREGEEPILIKTQDTAKAIKTIVEQQCADYEHIAIICKCKAQAKELAKKLKNKIDFKILETEEDYNAKIVIATCAMSKGIEFDAVIIPNADKENYNNNLDKNILYVSSTRALHKLFFLCEKDESNFIKHIKINETF